MKQLSQNLRTGEILLQEVPAPMARPGCVLIQTHKSLISPGTEKMLIDFANADFIQKARSQPQKVRLACDKIRSDGLLPTIRKIYNKLQEPIPLGYCNVGHVLQVGEGVHDIRIGDRVISNGPHAEIVCVPRNLVAKVPVHVADEAAVFTIMASIALNAIRLTSPTLGETVVVMGLGLVGLLTAELLKLSGCNVIGIELDSERRATATFRNFVTIDPNCIDPEKQIFDLTNGAGADAVIIATSSQSGEVVAQAASMARKRGKIVLIGTAALTLDRSVFYSKELTFQVSCSYGPGRYDTHYEQIGLDYPLPYVRWTENRNFEAILQLLSSQTFDPTYLISKTFDLEHHRQAYQALSDAKSVAIILNYPATPSLDQFVKFPSHSYSGQKGVIGIIGAGNYTSATMLPLLKNHRIKYVASAQGFSAAHLAKKYKIAFATTDYQQILQDPEVDLVIIATRHHLHASMAIDALNAAKHVFVEKPLAISAEQLDEIINKYYNGQKTLTVGFNRRFSPHLRKMKALLGAAMMNVVITVNAGFFPKDSWVHDLKIGGGRIIGEACHFIDLVVFLTGSKISSVCMNAMQQNATEATDNATILLKCANGSTGVVNYFSNGHPDYPKERIEVHSAGRTLVLDNFKTLKGFGFKGFTRFSSSQDKGHANTFDLLIDRVKNGGEAIIPFDEIVNTSTATLAALESLKLKSWIDL
jgi:predicted dehydrogenase/threonine dehydrogenase-like Zn-dependent dehydrogenase